MAQLTNISIKEHIILDNIKDLIDNLKKNPNRILINQLLQVNNMIKKNIDNLDISEKHKKYYENIILNSELLNDDKSDDKSDFSVFSTQSNPTEFTFKNPLVNYEDPNLIKKHFSYYPALDCAKLNDNFYKITSKLIFY